MIARDRSNGYPLVGPIALVLLALLLVVPGSGAVEVVPSSDELPHVLYGYGLAEVDGKAYLVGGAIADRSYTDEIRVLEPDGSSSVVAELPERLNEPAVASIGSRVYIFGGATQPSENQVPTTSSSIYRFDTSTGEVDRLFGTSLPDAVSSASAVRQGSSIYVMGGLSIASGTNGPVVDWQDTIARFDTQSESIEEMDLQLPSGRGQMAAVGLDASILLFGGMAERGGQHACEGDASACVTDEIVRVRPQGSVGRIGTLPTALRWAGAAVEDGTAYVLGGCQNNCGGHFGQDSIVAVDVGSGDASELAISMPVKGGRHSAVVLDGLATLPGGVKATGSPENPSEPHAKIHRLRLGVTTPWAPPSLTANPAPDSGVRLDWQAPSYDGGSPITSYEVLRSKSGSEPEPLGEVQDTEFTDPSTRLGTTYGYQVRAINTAGAGPPSNTVHITPTATPAAPDLAASGGNEKVLVQWSAPSDTGGSAITGYRLYAFPAADDPDLGDCQASDACWGELAGSATFATVQSAGGDPLENGQTYAFRLQARNDNGWGVLSEPVEATPAQVPDPPGSLSATKGTLNGQSVVNLTWEPSDAPDVSSYAIHRGRSVDQLTELERTTAREYTDATGIQEGATYHYAVAAIGPDGEGPRSQVATVVFSVPPGEVGNLTASWTGTEVEVWWEAPSDTGGAPLDGYEVARTRGARPPTETNGTIHTVDDAPFEDTSAPRGQPVVYHVRAVGPGGTGPWSLVQVRVPLTDDTIPPKAVVSVKPSKANVGDTITFDASGSTDDTAVVAYRFAFGDGESTGWRSGPQVTHVYKSEGVYEASIHVRDTQGLESTEPATPVIAIGPAPEDDGDEPPGPGDGDTSNGTPVPLIAPFVGLAAAAFKRRRSR